MNLITDPILLDMSIVHHCPITGVYVHEGKKGQWTVYEPASCAVTSDSTYLDLSIAVARCDYLAKRLIEKGSK